MALTVSTIAASKRLTRREAVRAELGAALAPSSDDSLIDTLIDSASAAIVSYCHREFAREALSETLPGYGNIHLQLKRTPVVAVSSVADSDGNVITDYSVASPDRGWLYRRAGWLWSTQAYPGLSAGGRFLDIGSPIPASEEPLYAVAYTAGYILPEQNIISAADISASAVDNSFNSAGSGFPALLKSGDVIVTAGFSNSENNGRFLVTGTPTSAKIVVTATLATEAADDGRSMTFLPPANARPFDDVQKAAIETIKVWYTQRRDDLSVIEKQVGQMRIRRSENSPLLDSLALPVMAVSLLRPWVRAA